MSTHHDTLVYRLAQILIKLNQGESLDPVSLAEEFGVNLRTIQRDLNCRLAYLPLEKVDRRYRLDPAYLGKLSTKDVERFASLAGVKGLFPSLANDFLRDIFDSRVQATFLVKGHHYENLSGKESLFKSLEQAIIARHPIAFEYSKSDGVKASDGVAPYKLINHKGIWYLMAQDAEKLKAFSLTKINNLTLLDKTFQWNEEIEKQIVDEDGIWFSADKQEVVIKVDANVAEYFKRRCLIANQKIEKELTDGGLIISTQIAHINQVLPIVRYWIPHLRIISPEKLQKQLEEELSEYLKA